MEESCSRGQYRMTGHEEDGVMVIYTDGSVEEGIRNGGATCYPSWREEEISRRRAVGRWSSSFVADRDSGDERKGKGGGG